MTWHNIFFETETLTVLELAIRTTILFFCLFLSAKAIGHRQVGIITPHNFLVAAGLSHIAASRMVNPKSNPIDSIAIIALYTLLNITLAYIGLKKPKLILQKPTLLVKDGKVLKDNLSKSNLTIHNLMFHLRLKDSFSLKHIKEAYFEPIGEFSVKMDPKSMPPEKAILNISNKAQALPEVIIYKGDIDEKVLRRNGLDQKWLQEQLMNNGRTTAKDIFLGLLEADKSLYISD